MSNEVVIRVENLGKCYQIAHQANGHQRERYTALRDVIAGTAMRPFRSLREKLKSNSKADFPDPRLNFNPATSTAPAFPDAPSTPLDGEADLPTSTSTQNLNSPRSEAFWALNDVSFEVKRGEVVGIIGRNGAGKSTLLKILSRITEPTTGRVGIKGRVASLLEVGTGFHPELTGRENIYLNGAILGMPREEITRKFEEIVVFAEVEKFLDTPVKRYSSGMYVRLAFAVAAHLEPEILIVDEVLAVGDAQFQKKCLGRIRDVSETDGITVLFVSHNMTAVRSLCSRGIVLKEGRTAFLGNPEESIREYMVAAGKLPTKARWSDLQRAPGNDNVRITAVRAVSKRLDNEDPLLFDMDTPVDIEIELTVLKQSRFHITLVFSSDQGAIAFTSGCSQASGWLEEPTSGSYKLISHIPPNLLNEGGYAVRVMLIEDGTRATLDLNDVIGFDVKDLKPRAIGSWHGREPGPVRPSLDWSVVRAA